MPRKTPGYRLGNVSPDPLSTCAKYPSSLWLVPSGPIGLLLDWDVGFARIGIQISRVSSFSFPSLFPFFPSFLLTSSSLSPLLSVGGY